MSQAIRIHNTGGPEVLTLEDVEDRAPGEGEIVIGQKAVGINFIDIYHRKGLYPLPMPAILGIEACGYVEEIGRGVQGIRVGDRVAYATGPVGAYCKRRVIAQQYVVNVPDEVSDEQVAAILAKGMTAHYLACRTFVTQPGTVMIVHAAAGGVGQLLCRWGHSRGCTVIGTVGSDEKAAIVQKNGGCQHIINYNTENFVERVRDITKGAGVNVVYDSVGKDTFLQSLECLKPLGMMVSYGQSSGAIPPFDVSLLSENCLFLTRPNLGLYKGNRMELILSAAEVFAMLKNGTIRANITNRYALKDAALAHQKLEDRQTTGASVFILGG